MAGRRHFRLGVYALGVWCALPSVGQKSTLGLYAETPDASVTSSETAADTFRWILTLGGEVDADFEHPELAVEVRLDRTRGIDPLMGADALHEEDLRRLQLLPELERLTLESRGALTDEGLVHLGQLAKLRTLNLRGTRITGSGFVHLQQLDNLQELNLSHCKRLTGDSLVHLAELAILRRLALDGGGDRWFYDDGWTGALRRRREMPAFAWTSDHELAACRGGIADDGLKAIGRIKSLQSLSLRLTSITDAGLPAIADLENLEELDLSYTAVSGDGLRALVKLTKLKRLVLDFTPIVDANLSVLKDFPQLVSLSLRGTAIGDEALANLSLATNLRQLDLDSTRITDQGLRHLGNLNRLEDLSLKRTSISLQGATALSAIMPRFTWERTLLSTGLAQVDENGDVIALNLQGQAVADVDLPRLAIFTQVQHLDLRNTQVTDEGLSVMARLPGLKVLYLSGTPVTDAGLTKLADNKKLAALPLADTKVTLAGILHLFVGLHGRSVEEALTATGLLTKSELGRKVDLRGLAASAAELKSVSTVPDLRVLFIDGPRIDDEAASQVAANSHLEALWMDGGALDRDGLDALATLPKLQELWLTRINADFRSLKMLPQLVTLNVSGSQLDMKAQFFLGRLPHLRTLIVDSLDYDRESLAGLAQNLPNVNLIVSQRDAIAAVRGSSSRDNVSTTVEGPGELRSRFGDECFERAERVYLKGTEPLGVVAGLTTLTHASVVASEHASRMIPDLANIPRLRAVSFYRSQLADQALEQLVALPELEELDLQRTTISDDGLQHVGRMVGLKHLSLGDYGTQIHDAGLRHLAGLVRLERLELNRTLITDAGLDHLAGLQNLKELQLRETAVNGGVKQLAALKHLERLDLAYTDVTDDTAAAFAAMESLTAVDLTNTFVTAAAAAALMAQHPRLQITPSVYPNIGEEQTVVRELGALRVRLSADGQGRVSAVDARDATNSGRVVQLVRKLPHVTKLRVGPSCTDADLEGLGDVATIVELNLSNSRVTDQGLIYLRGLPSLTHLDLSRTAISDAASAEIATHDSLVMLSLGGTKVSDVMLERLAALKHLATLIIDGVDVSAQGLAVLGRFTALNVVCVRGIARLTDDDVDALQQALPSCRIIYRRDAR